MNKKQSKRKRIASVNIRIYEQSHKIVRDLSEREGKTMARIIHEAVEKY